MTATPARYWPLLLLGSWLYAQPYTVGEVVGDFSAPICANGSGTFQLHDYNGAANGGDYHVIWLGFFASW